jgi:hypothetical protein
MTLRQMKRIRSEPDGLKPDPWTALSELFQIPPCHSAQELEHQLLQLSQPVVFEAGDRSRLSREVLDALESVQQKSDCVYVIWESRQKGCRM